MRFLPTNRFSANFGAVIILLLLMVAACQSPDVGQSCLIDFSSQDGQPPISPSTSPGDYLETGQPACENLVCIQSAKSTGAYGKYNPYCSKPCVSNKECFTAETGLVCREMVLNEEFIKSLSDEARAKYLGNVQFSNYCAVPLSAAQ